MKLGRQSEGLALTRPASPPTRRLNSRMGLSSPQPISRHTRSDPVAVLSSVKDDTCHSVSPRVRPPRLVFQKSLGDGAQPSPKSSHIALPANGHAADPQKPNP